MQLYTELDLDEVLPSTELSITEVNTIIIEEVHRLQLI